MTDFSDLYDDTVKGVFENQKRATHTIFLEVELQFANRRLALATDPLRTKPVSPGYLKHLKRKLQKAETDLAAWKLSRP